MITKKLLLVAIITTSILLPAAVRAQGIQIEIGDRPFYSHGPRYWAGDSAMIWVPGHMSNSGHHWIHGHYIRGERRHHDDRYNDRRDDYRDDYRR